MDVCSIWGRITVTRSLIKLKLYCQGVSGPLYHVHVLTNLRAVHNQVPAIVLNPHHLSAFAASMSFEAAAMHSPPCTQHADGGKGPMHLTMHLAM